MSGPGDRIQKQETSRRRYYHPTQKDSATLLQTGEETGGERTLIEVEVAPGGGTDPHYHLTYEENFEVLEGALEVLVGKETRTLRPGQQAGVPRKTIHRFRNTTDQPARFLVELRPGHAGFEKALMVGYSLVSDNNGTLRNPYRLALLLEWSNIRFPGSLFTVAEPLLRLLTKRARRKGIDKELEARYCQ